MKRAVTLLIALALLLSPAFPALAADKEEVVYAVLDNDGAQKTLYVVNCFESAGEEAIEDFGAYAAVTNLTEDKALTLSGDAVSLRLPKGRSYYQGDGLNKPLPWLITLGYTLDGDDIDPRELAGKSGLVGVKIGVAPNPGSEYDPAGFTVQITVTLNGDKCGAISAPGGTLAASGGNRLITYALLPGMSAEYTFTTQARDFYLPAIQLGCVRMEMDGDMYMRAFTADLSEVMRPIAEAMLQNALTKMRGNGPVSFADPRNEVKSIQFVLVTEGIFPASAPAAQAPEAPKEQGFFQRLSALFGL